jgi:hypothetical protein
MEIKQIEPEAISDQHTRVARTTLAIAKKVIVLFSTLLWPSLKVNI